jgi:exosortase H (IPTLxxWG-CTERM-specific)
VVRQAKRKPRHQPPAAPPPRRPVRRFIVLFALFMGLYYFITVTELFREHVFPAYLRANARAAAAILDLFGENPHVFGESISTPRFAVSIVRGCDAVEPTALFIAATLAFPAAWRRKWPALLIGPPLLLGFNLVRIVSLYYTGAFAPRLFEMMHIEVWQGLFIFLTLVLWIGWAWWASRPAIGDAHPSG